MERADWKPTHVDWEGGQSGKVPEELTLKAETQRMRGGQKTVLGRGNGIGEGLEEGKNMAILKS